MDPSFRGQKSRLSIPTEFGFQLNQETPYCLAQLREINPETQRSYADDIVAQFRQAYKDVYHQNLNTDFKGSDEEIDEIFRQKLLNGAHNNSDFATLLYQNFVARPKNICLPESEIQARVKEFMHQNVRKFAGLTEQQIDPLLANLFQNGGGKRWGSLVDGGIYITRNEGDYIALDLSWGAYPEQNKQYFNRLILSNEYLRSYAHYALPGLTEKIGDFKKQLLSDSMTEGGISAAQDELFPGYAVTDKILKPLARLVKSGWSCGADLGMGKTDSYGSLLAPSEYCGSIVFDDDYKPYKEFHDFVNAHPGELILDIAGAIGANTLRHINTNPVILNDINVNELAVAYAFARKFSPDHKGNLKLNSLSALDLNIPSDSVTATFMGYIVKYFTGEQLDTLFVKAYKFTKPGGRLFIIELNPDNGWYEDHKELITPKQGTSTTKNWKNEWGYVGAYQRNSPMFIHNLTVDDIVNALKRAGFQINEQNDKGHFWVVAEKPE